MKMNWRNPRGQVIIEYTVLLTILAAVTAMSTAAFFSRVCRSSDGRSSVLERYQQDMTRRIAPARGEQ